MSDTRLIITALLLVVVMVLAGWIGYRRRIGAVMLALLSVVWLTVDRDWEGGIIVSITPNHGFTDADIVGVLGLVVSAGLFLRRRR